MPRVEPGLVRCCSSMVRVTWSDAAVPEEIASATFASPKSSILACPRSVTKILAGLMSRCTMPLECAASSASAISIARCEQRLVVERTPGNAVLERRALKKLHRDE